MVIALIAKQAGLIPADIFFCSSTYDNNNNFHFSICLGTRNTKE
jgi:hypothetical protein